VTSINIIGDLKFLIEYVIYCAKKGPSGYPQELR